MVAGRDSHAYRQAKTELRHRRLPCWLCGQRIDYTLHWSDPMSFSADHVRLLSTHAHLADDPANLRPAHLDCNKRRGDRPPPPPLGDTSGEW